MKKHMYSFLFFIVVFLLCFFLIQFTQFASVRTESFIFGVMIGIVSLIFLYALEFFVFSYQWFRFVFHVINSLLYIGVLCVIFFIIFFLLNDPYIFASFISPFYLGIMVALLAGLVYQLIASMFELIGSEGFRYVFTKIYLHPKQEERIFLSIDLANSTSLAHKLGEEKYIQFVNAFFEDVAQVIEKYHGTIYKYVGDEVIITWKAKYGSTDARCMKAVKEIFELFQQKKKWYKQKYQTIPYFRAGMHVGNVMVGVIGARRKEVAYIGSVLNVTSRIQVVCKEYNESFLCSKSLIEMVALPKEMHVAFVDKRKLRGVARSISLYTIK